MQLQRNSQLARLIERVQVGQKRTRRRAARLALQHRSLDLDEAASVHEAPHLGDDLRTRPQHPLSLRVRHQVDVSTAIALLLVAQPVVLLGRRAQRLGQRAQIGGLQRHLAAPRADHLSGRLDEITEVETVDPVPRVAQRPPAGQHLQRAAVILKIDEGDPPHVANRMRSPGDGDRLGRLRLTGLLARDEELARLRQRVGATGARRKRIQAHRTLLVGTLAAFGDDLAQIRRVGRSGVGHASRPPAAAS